MNIKIESQLEFKQYLKLQYKLYYRNTMIVIVTIIGSLQFIFSTLYFCGIKALFDNPPYLQMLLGTTILFVLPFSIYTDAKKNFAQSSVLNEKLTYEFSDDNFKIVGKSFNAELNWSIILRVQILRDWVLLYQNKTVANLIPKQAFGAQLDEFLNFIKNKRIPNNTDNSEDFFQ